MRELAPSGWTETTPPGNAYLVTMTSGLKVKGENFGDFKLGTISGTDTLAAGDPGLTVQPANLDANANGVLDPGEVSTVTAADGTSSFTGLGPGTYSVREVVPAGWTETTPPGNAYRVTMTSGLAATGENFGDHHVHRTWSSLSASSGGKQVWLFDEFQGKLITPGSNSVSIDSISFDPSQWQNSAADTDDGIGDWIVDL